MLCRAASGGGPNERGEGIRLVEVELGRRGVDFFFPLKTYVDIGIHFFRGGKTFLLDDPNLFW